MYQLNDSEGQFEEISVLLQLLNTHSKIIWKEINAIFGTITLAISSTKRTYRTILI